MKSAATGYTDFFRNNGSKNPADPKMKTPEDSAEDKKKEAIRRRLKGKNRPVKKTMKAF